MLWWSWPAVVDPLSSMLCRTPLFSHWSPVSPIVPVVIDFDRDIRPEGTPAQGAALRFHELLEQLVADGPAVIAIDDIDVASAFLKVVSAVDANPQAATILLPTILADRFPEIVFPDISPNQTASLSSPNGKLRFNVITNDLPNADRLPSAQTAPFRISNPVEKPSVSVFARLVAARYRSATSDAKSDDTRIVPRSLGPPETHFSPADEFIVVGGHRRFFNLYPSSALLSGSIPRGTFANQIVLLGKLSGRRAPTALGALPVDQPVTSTAIGVWAVLNAQIAGRPPWVLWIECGFILAVALFPSVFMRHYSMPAAWMASGATACALAAGAAAVWHLRGLMVQPGAALLALFCSTLYASLLMGSHRDRPKNMPAEGNSPSARPLPETPHGRVATPPVEKDEVSDLSESGKRTEDGLSPPVNVAEEKSPWEKIGRYEILRCIGKGAMGEVFLGRDPHINRLTAIKTMRFKDNFVEDEIAEIREKFFREAESAGTLSHPNIVTIYDAGEDRERAYIAMEYLEGITLLRFTHAKRLLPVQKVVAYLTQIAKALDYAHRRGIVHRDIKPANIMVLKRGAIKITDFGIARITASSHTQTGVVKGTPYYMSPEQFSGDKVDGRSDIFSLGTLLFQLLTGTLPFFSESPAVLMNQIMNFPHPNPRSINPRVLPAIIPIVDQALEKDRTKRYQRAAQMAADLTRLKKRIDRYLRDKKAVSNAQLDNAGPN